MWSDDDDDDVVKLTPTFELSTFPISSAQGHKHVKDNRIHRFKGYSSSSSVTTESEKSEFWKQQFAFILEAAQPQELQGVPKKTLFNEIGTQAAP